MQSLLKSILILFSIVGIAATSYVIRTSIQDHKREKAFEANCRNVLVGMTVQENTGRVTHIDRPSDEWFEVN